MKDLELWFDYADAASKGPTVNQIAASILVAIGLCVFATACKKKEDAAPSPAASAAPASGCGSDYADPQKEFCLKLPATYTAGAPETPNELYSVDIKFEGPANNGVHVLVGSTSSNFKTYDEQFKSDDTWVASKATLESSGPMTGTGKWWSYTNQGYKSFKAMVKSNGDKTIFCEPTNTVVVSEVIEICKTLRAYPK